MTTPDEFLQFAKDMGLGSTKSTSSTLPSRTMSNNNGYTTTGLSVLNNLCRLIEQIHQLKAENNHLRAHLDLVDNVDKFQQRFLFKQNHENNKEDHKKIISSISHHDEEKLGTISPTNSLEIKQSKLDRDQKGKCLFLYYVKAKFKERGLAMTIQLILTSVSFDMFF
jgi:hypothetical protein